MQTLHLFARQFYLDSDIGVLFCPWFWKGWLEVIDIDNCDHQAAQAMLGWSGAEVSGLDR